MMKITPTFPSFLAVDMLDVDLGSIETYCYDVMERDGGRKLSNDGGYQSRNLDLDLESPLTSLLKQIEQRSNTLHGSLMFKSTFRQKIDNAWINVNKRGDYNIPHVHPRACFSGVFYVKAPKNSGDLFLRSPVPNLEHVITDTHIDKYSPFTSPTLGIPPEAGKLVLFPSWILHYVKSNQSDTDRISIAFNTVFRRTDMPLGSSSAQS